MGGDPLEALNSGTFAPGDVNDPTAAGNTCDDANDPKGCIFTQNLIVFDATEDEISAAVGGTLNSGNDTNSGDSNIGNQNPGKNNTETAEGGESNTESDKYVSQTLFNTT